MSPKYSQFGMLELLLLVSLMLAAFVLPLARSAHGDRGDAERHVVLPTPRSVSGFRVAAFVLTTTALAAALLFGARRAILDQQGIELWLLRLAMPGFAGLPSYLGGVFAVYSLLLALGLLVLALFLRASILRRLYAAGYAVMFIALLTVMNSIFVVVAIKFSITLPFFR